MNLLLFNLSDEILYIYININYKQLINKIRTIQNDSSDSNYFYIEISEINNKMPKVCFIFYTYILKTLAFRLSPRITSCLIILFK